MDNPFFTTPVHTGATPAEALGATLRKPKAPRKVKSSKLEDGERGHVVQFTRAEKSEYARIDSFVEDKLLIAMCDFVKRGWCSGFSGLSADGRRVGQSSREAAQFSLYGAFERARDEYLHEAGIGFNKAWLFSEPIARRLACAAGVEVPERELEWMRGFNDAAGRTQEQVVGLIERAVGGCVEVVEPEMALGALKGVEGSFQAQAGAHASVSAAWLSVANFEKAVA